MYITIQSIKKTMGKFIEMQDLYMGIPMFFIFLILFSFSPLKIFSLVFLSICIFLMLPITISKKNRMYKVLLLLFRYLFRIKDQTYFSRENQKKKEVMLNGLIKKRFKKGEE